MSGLSSACAAIDALGPLIAQSSSSLTNYSAFSGDHLSNYLEKSFGSELISQSSILGLQVDRLEDRFVAFPVIIQVQPKSCSIKINGKRSAGIRPSYVAQQIKELQSKPGTKPEQFNELLFSAACYVSRENVSVSGVYLDDVYEILTIHPDAKKSYSRADFARDLFILDTSDVSQTRHGLVRSFPAATGTKGATSKVFTVVGPDRHPRHYLMVRFAENNQ